MTTFPEHFLWGAATAGHQIEGNNVNSDWWAREQQMPGMELSGDACDSYHRYARRHPAARRRRPDLLPIQPGVVAHRADPRTLLHAPSSRTTGA